MSSDKTFRFDESVCGRCGRTAPAGCICVGAKAFQPGRRVHAGEYAAGLGRMNNPQGVTKEETAGSGYRGYIVQSGDDENTTVRRVTAANPFHVFEVPNDLISYVDDVEPETAEEEAAGKVPFDVYQPEVVEDYERGRRDFEAARSKKTFRNDELVGYRTRTPHTREDDKWQSDQPFYGSSYVRNHSQDFFSEGFDIPVAEGDEEYSAGDEPFEDEGTKAFVETKSQLFRHYRDDAGLPRMSVYSDTSPVHQNPNRPYADHEGEEQYANLPDVSFFGGTHRRVDTPERLAEIAELDDTDAPLPDAEEQYANLLTLPNKPVPGQPQRPAGLRESHPHEKNFKALSDLIGYDMKASLFRYYRPASGELRADMYQDTSGRIPLEDQQRISQHFPVDNPNAPYGSTGSQASMVVEGSYPDLAPEDASHYRDDTPERLAEIAAEDDAEPEEHTYDGKMLSYLSQNIPSAKGVTLSVGSKRQRDSDFHEKMLSYLNMGSGGALVPPPEFTLKAKKKKKTVQGEGKAFKPGQNVRVRSEYLGNPNEGLEPDHKITTGGINPVPLEPGWQWVEELAPGSTDQTVGGPVARPESRLQKSIPQAPRVKMGVMRATAPNRIDLVVEIVAKLFNEQAVQQFLQEMAGGIPPQQEKMFGKAYLRTVSKKPNKAVLARRVAERNLRGLPPVKNPVQVNYYRDSFLNSSVNNPNKPYDMEIRSDHSSLDDGESGSGETRTSTRRIDKHLYVPFVKNLRGHLVKAGFTGTMQDAMGRRMCFSAGKRVHCARDERGTHDDKVRQEEAPVPGNLSSGEGTANPVVQGIDVLKEIKFRIQGIASQCSLPPNAVRDVVLFLLEIPDEILIAFNAELDIRGEEIRAVLSQVIGSMVPQPEGMVDGGKPIPPSLGKSMESESVWDDDTGERHERDYPDHMETAQTTPATPSELERLHGIIYTNASTGRVSNEMANVWKNRRSRHLESLPPPEGQKSNGLGMSKKAWDGEAEDDGERHESDYPTRRESTDRTPLTPEEISRMAQSSSREGVFDNELRNVIKNRRTRDLAANPPNIEGQKGFPSPDLVLYEMQKNPNPTELERMQMELLMRILNDR